MMHVKICTMFRSLDLDLDLDLEEQCLLPVDRETMNLNSNFHEEIGEYFDCSLCNHYPNEESACKFHTDPEHGTYWERLTCVVSAGNQDVRKFAFRPIPNENRWSAYESRKMKANNRSKHPAGNGNDNGSSSTTNSGGGEDEDIAPAIIPLF
eukprot:301768_1